MVSFHGEPVDPLHLRVLKEGTLVFALPAPRAPTGSGIPGSGAAPFGPAPRNVPGGRPPNNGYGTGSGGKPGN